MEPPLFPPCGLHTVRAAPGSPANLVLPLPAGSPPFHYSWSRAGASLDERFTTSHDATGVRLTVSAARTGDTDVYTLQARNAAGTDTSRVRLEVSSDEAPTGEDPPTFLRRLQDLTVKVGTRTRFLVEIVSSTECKVTWYRNERRLLEAERVSLARDGNFWCADVSAVSVDDAGRWTCTAENVGGRASCSAHLNVLVPKAYKRPEFVEELRALLTEQGTVSLECKVVGVPTPVLRWFKDSREIKAGDVFALTANAEDPTSLGTYTCEAVNCMGRAYSSSKVHVVGRGSREGSSRPSSSLAPEPPPIFTKELEDQYIKITEPLTLGCHIVVPPWPRSVVWYNKEGKVDPSDRYHILEDGAGGYLLEIASAEWPDEGEWKCVACSSGGRVGISTCYVTMDVPKNYRKPRFMENLQAVLTEEGLVSFECKVVGFPTPVLSWFKDGQELKPGDVYQLTGTNSLGSYCCIARNCMGQASSSAELTVEDIQNQLNEEEKHQLFQAKNQAPKFIHGLKSVEAKIDEPFRFTVKVAIPPEPSVLWYRDDQPVDESSRCHHDKEDRGVFCLDIQSLEFLDQAEWKCVAMNNFGHSVTSCFLKLIIPRHYKKPRFLENLQAILSDEGAVNLECKVIGVPQPVLKWYKDGEELKPGDIHRIISGQDGTCCLGTYTCEAQNCMGIAASSASLLGFEDSLKAKKKKAEEMTLQRNLSLSTIHEERTSQMYDTPVGDITLNDDKGEISFSFDGKEVSVSLYETPDLTEEEALQIVEMYADQLSENITEHNVVELPPLRFVKETSTSGNLLMEAVIIDVSPDYFQSPDEDLRTEADVEDISIVDENAASLLSLDQEDIGREDYLEKTMALLSEEKSDILPKVSRKKSDSQKSADDFFSLSRDQSLSEEKKDDDTQPMSEGDMPSFASAQSSGKPKSLKPFGEDGQESSEPTKTVLLKEERKKRSLEVEQSSVLRTKRERRSSRGSRRSSSGSDKSVGKSREELQNIDPDEPPNVKMPHTSEIEFEQKAANISNCLSKLITDVQIIERDIILKSEFMSSAATASKSLEIISSLISPLSEIHSIVEAAKETVIESKEVSRTMFNCLPKPLKVLQQSLTVIGKCIDMESDGKTLVKKTCVACVEVCGYNIHKLLSDINEITSRNYLTIENVILTEINLLSNDINTVIQFSVDMIKARNLIRESSEFKSGDISQEVRSLRDTQKAIFELRNPINSLLYIVERADKSKIANITKVNNSKVLLNDMSGSIQDLQTALEQVESLSVKEATSELEKYNTKIIESVMESVIKLRNSFEELSTETNEDKTILNHAITSIKESLNDISTQIKTIESNVDSFDVLASDNKLNILQKMAQILIGLENNLQRLDTLPELKTHMIAFHKDLTKILENVIECNESQKYFAFMEICDGINRINTCIKNFDVDQVTNLASLYNTLYIIHDQFIKSVFDSQLNCSILTNINESIICVQESMNCVEEISMQVESDHIQDITPKTYQEIKADRVIEHIELTIAAIENVKVSESAHDMKLNFIPIFQNICPILTQLKQSIAASTTYIEDGEYINILSESSSLINMVASPVCELNQNITILNNQIVESIESIKERSEILTTLAEPLHELYTTLEILQLDVISLLGEGVSSFSMNVNVASLVQNLQSCIVMIQEQAGVEGVDEISTLEDVSGIKTTADTLPNDYLVLPTAEETTSEAIVIPFEQEIQIKLTAQVLQTLNDHITILQTPDVVDILDTLSEVSDFSSLKSFKVDLGDLYTGIEAILHPIPMEGTCEIDIGINPAKLNEIAEPMQELQQSLSVLDISNIPIYESLLEMPADKIHSLMQIVSDFKEHLDKCVLTVFPALETADKTIEIANKVGILREVCEQLTDTFKTTKSIATVQLRNEIKGLEISIDHLLDAIDTRKGINIDQVKQITEDLYGKIINVQDEIIQFTPQSSLNLANEAQLIGTIDKLQTIIAVLQQYEFVDLSQASDIASIEPQVALELESNSLTQISEVVDNAVNVVQVAFQDTLLVDLMIVEDFFKSCKIEFTILRSLISKPSSHKKIIRLLQEFKSLRSIINSFKTQRSELSIPENIDFCLSTFLINADDCLQNLQSCFENIVESQAELLVNSPLRKFEIFCTLVNEIKVTKYDAIINDVITKFAEILEIAKIRLTHTNQEVLDEIKQIKSEVKNFNELIKKLDDFALLIEQSKEYIVETTTNNILQKVLICIEKHQDYKCIHDTGRNLILIKCLSDCTDILQENVLDIKCADENLENRKLQETLIDMLQSLQVLNNQLTNVQEQISIDADGGTISVDSPKKESLESLVKIMAGKHKEAIENIETNVPVSNEDISLMIEVDKEIHLVQNNLKNINSIQFIHIVEDIKRPVEEIEKTLHGILSVEKVADNTLPAGKAKEIIQRIDQYIELIEIVEEISAIIRIEDIKNTVNIAKELRESFASSNLISQSDINDNKAFEISKEQASVAERLQNALCALHVQVLEHTQELALEFGTDVLQRIANVTSQLQANLVAVTGVDVALEIPSKSVIKNSESKEAARADEPTIRIDAVTIPAQDAIHQQPTIADQLIMTTDMLEQMVGVSYETTLAKNNQQMPNKIIHAESELPVSTALGETEVIAAVEVNFEATFTNSDGIVPDKTPSWQEKTTEVLGDTFNPESESVPEAEHSKINFEEKTTEVFGDTCNPGSESVPEAEDSKNNFDSVMQYIDQYISDDISEVVKEISNLSNNMQLEHSLDIAKQLHASIIKSNQDLRTEAVNISTEHMNIPQAQLFEKLQSALALLEDLHIANVIEISAANKEAIVNVWPIAYNLRTAIINYKLSDVNELEKFKLMQTFSAIKKSETKTTELCLIKGDEKKYVREDHEDTDRCLPEILLQNINEFLSKDILKTIEQMSSNLKINDLYQTVAATQNLLDNFGLHETSSTKTIIETFQDEQTLAAVYELQNALSTFQVVIAGNMEALKNFIGPNSLKNITQIVSNLSTTLSALGTHNPALPHFGNESVENENIVSSFEQNIDHTGNCMDEDDRRLTLQNEFIDLIGNKPNEADLENELDDLKTQQTVISEEVIDTASTLYSADIITESKLKKSTEESIESKKASENVMEIFSDVNNKNLLDLTEIVDMSIMGTENQLTADIAETDAKKDNQIMKQIQTAVDSVDIISTNIGNMQPITIVKYENQINELLVIFQIANINDDATKDCTQTESTAVQIDTSKEKTVESFSKSHLDIIDNDNKITDSEISSFGNISVLNSEECLEIEKDNMNALDSMTTQVVEGVINNVIFDSILDIKTIDASVPKICAAKMLQTIKPLESVTFADNTLNEMLDTVLLNDLHQQQSTRNDKKLLSGSASVQISEQQNEKRTNEFLLYEAQDNILEECLKERTESISKIQTPPISSLNDSSQIPELKVILLNESSDPLPTSKIITEQSLILHIDKFTSGEVSEVIKEIQVLIDSEQLNDVIEISKELKECLVSDIEDKKFEEIKVSQAKLALKLQDALTVLQTRILENSTEIACSKKAEALSHVQEVIMYLQNDLDTAIGCELPEILKSAEIVEVPETHENSMKQLERLLDEVIMKIQITPISVDDTESLKNNLDEVQIVIIKLKRDYDGVPDDTLKETLEDFECSVRSVQLQIDESCPPDLLNEACASLQLIVSNMSEIEKVNETVIPVVEDCEKVLEKCASESDETLKLLEAALTIECKDSKLLDIVTSLNVLKDTTKILKQNFTNNPDVLIEKGVEIIQSLGALEDKAFSLEKDLAEVIINNDARDSILTAIHSAYGSISNMRGTIVSVQKRYMFENYGNPSESLLKSIKNITKICEMEEKETCSWKPFSKSIRSILNHFEDIKFYINLDKTARLPSDAAFTKIILEELKSHIIKTLIPLTLRVGSVSVNKANKLLESVTKYLSNIESSVSLEVKDKIPIFKDVSTQLFEVTELIKTEIEKIQIDALNQINFDDKIPDIEISYEQIEQFAVSDNTDTKDLQSIKLDNVIEQTNEEALMINPQSTMKIMEDKLLTFTELNDSLSGEISTIENSLENQVNYIATDLVTEIALEAVTHVQSIEKLHFQDFEHSLDVLQHETKVPITLANSSINNDEEQISTTFPNLLQDTNIEPHPHLIEIASREYPQPVLVENDVKIITNDINKSPSESLPGINIQSTGKESTSAEEGKIGTTKHNEPEEIETEPDYSRKQGLHVGNATNLLNTVDETKPKRENEEPASGENIQDKIVSTNKIHNEVHTISDESEVKQEQEEMTKKDKEENQLDVMTKQETEKHELEKIESTAEKINDELENNTKQEREEIEKEEVELIDEKKDELNAKLEQKKEKKESENIMATAKPELESVEIDTRGKKEKEKLEAITLDEREKEVVKEKAQTENEEFEFNTKHEIEKKKVEVRENKVELETKTNKDRDNEAIENVETNIKDEKEANSRQNIEIMKKENFVTKDETTKEEVNYETEQDELNVKLLQEIESEEAEKNKITYKKEVELEANAKQELEMQEVDTRAVDVNKKLKPDMQPENKKGVTEENARLENKEFESKIKQEIEKIKVEVKENKEELETKINQNIENIEIEKDETSAKDRKVVKTKQKIEIRETEELEAMAEKRKDELGDRNKQENEQTEKEKSEVVNNEEETEPKTKQDKEKKNNVKEEPKAMEENEDLKVTTLQELETIEKLNSKARVKKNDKELEATTKQDTELKELEIDSEKEKEKLEAKTNQNKGYKENKDVKDREENEGVEAKTKQESERKEAENVEIEAKNEKEEKEFNVKKDIKNKVEKTELEAKGQKEKLEVDAKQNLENKEQDVVKAANKKEKKEVDITSSQERHMVGDEETEANTNKGKEKLELMVMQEQRKKETDDKVKKEESDIKTKQENINNEKEVEVKIKVEEANEPKTELKSEKKETIAKTKTENIELEFKCEQEGENKEIEESKAKIEKCKLELEGPMKPEKENIEIEHEAKTNQDKDELELKTKQERQKEEREELEAVANKANNKLETEDNQERENEEKDGLKAIGKIEKEDFDTRTKKEKKEKNNAEIETNINKEKTEMDTKSQQEKEKETNVESEAKVKAEKTEQEANIKQGMQQLKTKARIEEKDLEAKIKQESNKEELEAMASKKKKVLETNIGQEKENKEFNDKEVLEVQAKEVEEELKVKNKDEGNERKELEAEAKKEKKEVEAWNKTDKERKEKEESVAKDKKEKLEDKKEREVEKNEREESEAKAVKEKEDLEANIKKEMEEAEAKTKKKKENFEAKTKQVSEKDISEAKASKDNKELEAKIMLEREIKEKKELEAIVKLEEKELEAKDKDKIEKREREDLESKNKEEKERQEKKSKANTKKNKKELEVVESPANVRKDNEELEAKTTPEKDIKATKEFEAIVKLEEKELEAKKREDKEIKEREVSKNKEEKDRKEKQESETKAKNEKEELEAKIKQKLKELEAKQKELEANMTQEKEKEESAANVSKDNEELEAKTTQEKEIKEKEEFKAKVKLEEELEAKDKEEKEKMKRKESKVTSKKKKEELEAKNKAERERKETEESEAKTKKEKKESEVKEKTEAEKEERKKENESEAKAKKEKEELDAKKKHKEERKNMEELDTKDKKEKEALEAKNKAEKEWKEKEESEAKIKKEREELKANIKQERKKGKLEANSGKDKGESEAEITQEKEIIEKEELEAKATIEEKELEAKKKEEKGRIEFEVIAKKKKEEFQPTIKSEKEKEKEEFEAKGKKEKEKLEAKTKQELEVKARNEKEELEANIKQDTDKKKSEAKARKDKEESEAKNTKEKNIVEKEEFGAKAEMREIELESKNKEEKERKEREELESIAKKEKEELEAKNKVEKKGKDKEEKLEAKKENNKFEAKKEREAEKEEREELEAKAKKEKEEFESKIKLENEKKVGKESEAKAKKEKQELGAKIKNEMEEVEANAKKRKEDLEAKQERVKEESEDRVSKNYKELEANTTQKKEIIEKEELEAKIKLETNELEAKNKEVKERKQREESEAKAKKEKEELEAKNKEEKEKKEKEESESKVKIEREELEAEKKKEEDKKNREESEAKAKKEKEELEAKNKEEKENKKEEESEAKIKTEREELEAKKKRKAEKKYREESEAKAKKEKEELDASKKEEKEKKEQEESTVNVKKEEEALVAQKKRETDKKDREESEAKAKKEKTMLGAKTKQEKEIKDKEESEAKATKEKQKMETKIKQEKEIKNNEELEAQVEKEKLEAKSQQERDEKISEVKAKNEMEELEDSINQKKEIKEQVLEVKDMKEKEELEATEIKKKRKDQANVDGKKKEIMEDGLSLVKDERSEAIIKNEKSEAEANSARTKIKREKEEVVVKTKNQKVKCEEKSNKAKEMFDNKVKNYEDETWKKEGIEEEEEDKGKTNSIVAEAKSKQEIKGQIEESRAIVAKDINESESKAMKEKRHTHTTINEKVEKVGTKLHKSLIEAEIKEENEEIVASIKKNIDKTDHDVWKNTNEAEVNLSKDMKEAEAKASQERLRKEKQESFTQNIEEYQNEYENYDTNAKGKLHINIDDNGDIDNKGHYIKPSKQTTKHRSKFVDLQNRDVCDMDFLRPSGYTERVYDSDNRSDRDISSLGKTVPIYKTQTIILDSKLRSSMPPTSDRIESDKRLDRHRSKALSEVRSLISEKRSGLSRDLKRKPVFSTYLTDRTAVEGSRVKLTCSVLSSTDLKISWYKNGVHLDNKLKYRTKYIDGLITLEVLNAVPSDSAEYSCTVENENGSINSSATLKVYPSFEASPIPPTFTRSIRDAYHLAENELVLECRIRGQPLPTITWLKDDRLVSNKDRYQAYYLADGVCRLAISSPTSEDSGTYTCKAENSVWSDQITHVVSFTGKESHLSPNITTVDRTRFNRQALESRRPHFTNVLSDYKVTRGGTIGLQVEIHGSPTRVEWLREGCSVTEVYRNARTFVEYGLYTLALTDVTEKESGLYTCRAWSTNGNVDMNAAITVVQPNEMEGKPAIIVGRPDKDIHISVGEDINISFRVQGEPKPKVVFMKGIRDITTNQRVCKMTSDDYVKFTLKRSVVSDAGTYCVLARNAYGCDRAFVTVVVRQRASSENLISDWTYPADDSALSIGDRKYKSVPERIPGEPSVVDGGNNWISLAWPKSDPGNSAPVLAYKIESWLAGKEGGARWVELGITPLNSFDAFNLKQEEQYHFRVTPRNRYGWGESVQTSSPVGVGIAGDRPEFLDILPGQLKILAGETVHLSCSVKGKPLPEVVWMKNGHEIEEDSRVTATFNGQNCSLTIEDICIEDEARYSCEALNVHGRASTYARLAVVTDRLIWEADAKLKGARSQDSVGEYPPQFTMRLRDRRVQATYPVRLTCQVIGNPPPKLTWFKDGEDIVLDNRRCTYQDEHFHTLEVAPTTLEDGGMYEAMARNSSGAVSCRCSLVVDKGIRAYVAPEFCCGLEPLYRLIEGEELRISAVVEAYPSVGVTWYRDGVRLRPSRRAIMTLDRDGQIELALASVTSRDAGVYTCTASNEVGRASTSGKVEILEGDGRQSTIKRSPPVVINMPDVPYSKEPMFVRKPRSSEAREGDTVIIQCEVIGDPKPDVYWLRDFLKPDYYRDATHFKRVGEGPEYRFEIPHAKLDYTGAYSVVARNIHGEAKAIISLQILAKDPTMSDDTHNVRYGRVEVIARFERELQDLLSYDGDAVEFECRVTGNPEPDVRWFHYTNLIRDCPDFESTFEEGTARLKIKQVTAEDEGTYTCEASNSLGKTTSSACLVVYPPGEPHTLSQRLRRPPTLLSAASTPRSTPRSTPARSMSRTPGPDHRRLCSPSRQMAPSFYTYPFNKVVEEGDHVIFQCAVKGQPAPWTTWDKDGIILTPTARFTIKEKDDILRLLEIEQVTIEDVGIYRITVENEYGRAEASARLEVITQKGKFYGGVRAYSASPRKSLSYRRYPSVSRQD